MARTRTMRRAAFTLIELMVVITIIAVLVSLLVPAAYKALGFGAQTVARSEIAQLEAAVQSFQGKFGVSYMPSQIKLCKFYADYGTTQLDVDSIAYLTKLFPRLNTGSGAWSAGTGVNWTQDSTWTTVTTHPASGTGPLAVLEGHQCLVFFLGGIQITSGGTLGCTGFSTNQLDPSSTGAFDRIPPFFEFTPKQLTQVASNASSVSSYSKIFLSYLDPIGSPAKPYAYFSSYKTSNGYNRTAPTYTGYGTAFDNPTLGVKPYYLNGSSPTQYLKPDRFQIISAGADGLFGAGGAWTTSGSLSTGVAKDDLSNFASGQLGRGQ